VATIKGMKKAKLEENMRKRLERGAKKQAAKEARSLERRHIMEDAALLRNLRAGDTKEWD
jgi:hypothetical protein